MKKSSIILNGIFKENPTFVLFLGMCPVLATSKSIYSAIGMSVCVFLVLLLSNIIISLVSKHTPDEIRIPVELLNAVDNSAAKADISRNEFINQCIIFALEHLPQDLD